MLRKKGGTNIPFNSVIERACSGKVDLSATFLKK